MIIIRLINYLVNYIALGKNSKLWYIVYIINKGLDILNRCIIISNHKIISASLNHLAPQILLKVLISSHLPINIPTV